MVAECSLVVFVVQRAMHLAVVHVSKQKDVCDGCYDPVSDCVLFVSTRHSKSRAFACSRCASVSSASVVPILQFLLREREAVRNKSGHCL